MIHLVVVTKRWNKIFIQQPPRFQTTHHGDHTRDKSVTEAGPGEPNPLGSDWRRHFGHWLMLKLLNSLGVKTLHSWGILPLSLLPGTGRMLVLKVLEFPWKLPERMSCRQEGSGGSQFKKITVSLLKVSFQAWSKGWGIWEVFLGLNWVPMFMCWHSEN